MSEDKVGCTVPAAEIESSGAEIAPAEEVKKEAVRMGIMVGMKAPDFTAPAFYEGGFTTVQLSQFSGKWVALCFYPGDFTFV